VCVWCANLQLASMRGMSRRIFSAAAAASSYAGGMYDDYDARRYVSRHR
jgi:hypothetical protein